jgi:hypothetical protein
MRSLTRRVQGFLRQSPSRKMLFLEACVHLGWARLLLKIFSFRRLTWAFSSPLRKTVLSSAEREQLRRDVCWGIERAADLLPGKTVCFPRGIAAQIMCRKRGIDSILYYGAAVDPLTGLTAHVWVQDGAEGVVGHLVASRYGVLARFPA